jgi:hypothetical protein
VACDGAHAAALSLEVGTGDPEHPVFNPLPVDGRVDLFPGPQQGYHVYLQVRVTGVCPNRFLVKRKIREPGKTQVIRSQEEHLTGLVNLGGGDLVLPRAQPTFICPSNMPGVQMVDRELDLEVTFEEELGACDSLADGARTITQHVTIVPTCAETDTLCSNDWTAGCAAPP